MQNESIFFEYLIICLILDELSKAPEYICEYCGRLYKQEGRYNAHIEAVHNPISKNTFREMGVGVGGVGGVGGVVGLGGVDVGGVEGGVKVSIPHESFDELLQQNRVMIDIIKQQQEAITALLRHNNIML
jgi:hypothetical protein